MTPVEKRIIRSCLAFFGGIFALLVYFFFFSGVLY
jgi:hypothetical protein